MNAAGILERIRDLNVLVLGDVCLDRWCYYDPQLTEPSRETGIDRVAVVRTEVTPGAAGTIASNLVSLGVRNVSVLGAIGDDGFGWELLRALTTRRIGADLLVQSPDTSTFTYTKLINSATGVEDRGRVDFVSAQTLPAQVESEVIARLKNSFDRFDVLIVSDQAETETGGVVTPQIRGVLAGIAETSGKIVWVDSRVRLEHFRHVIAKPNVMEARQACMRAFAEVDLRRLRRHCDFRLLVVTDGENGARIIDSSEKEHLVPGRRVNPVDICGAGDSFSAGAACALAATGDPVKAAWFGNLIASITVQKIGTGTASPDEVMQAERDSG
jgi:rfaE bifunctional protein kinase chain/domain